MMYTFTSYDVHLEIYNQLIYIFIITNLYKHTYKYTFFFNDILKKTWKKNLEKKISQKKRGILKAIFLDDLSYFEHTKWLFSQWHFEKNFEKKLGFFFINFSQKKAILKAIFLDDLSYFEHTKWLFFQWHFEKNL